MNCVLLVGHEGSSLPQAIDSKHNDGLQHPAGKPKRYKRERS
jgi:hypothetical protein